MKPTLKNIGITLSGVLLLAASNSFAASDPAEEIKKMEADCMAKAEEMKAANMPDAEQMLEDCLVKIDEMKADEMKGAVEAIPEKVEPETIQSN